MFRNCLVSYPGQTKVPEALSYKLLPDLLKKNPEGLFRSPFLFESDQADQIITSFNQGKYEPSGPFILIHAIRHAKDLILDGCVYENLNLFLEVDGKKLPELPARQELEKLFLEEKTIINIDGKTYRPNTEVLGFQSVYDETVKAIEALKSMGVTQESMLILATPDEISIEVHPGVFGLPEDASLVEAYRNLLFKITGIRLRNKHTIKTTHRTTLLPFSAVDPQVLVPGSIHPSLHRPKVCVGPAHFAYGPAAFSDFCGKKRNLDDCVKELRAWIKFLETPIEPVAKLQAALSSLKKESPPAPTMPGPAAGTPQPAKSGGLQPFKTEIVEALSTFPPSQPGFSTPYPEFNKALAGGWVPRGVHLVAGSREEGKTAFLLNHAMHLAGSHGVLFVSREMRFVECVARLSAWFQKLSLADLQTRLIASSPEGQANREKYKVILKSLSGSASDPAAKALAPGGAPGISPSLSDNFFFRGADSSINPMRIDELCELVKLVTGGKHRVLILDSLHLPELEANLDYFSTLRQRASAQDFTLIAGIHLPPTVIAKPHLIDTPDLEVLQRWQHCSDAIVGLTSEKMNLKKFLAMSQGKVDPAVAEKLEQKFYQSAGSPKVRGDCYSFVRVIHSRLGLRTAILYLFQRELNRFYEGPSLPLSRP